MECLPSRKDDDHAAIDERTPHEGKKFRGEQNGSPVIVQRQRTDCRFHGPERMDGKNSRPVACSARATSLFSLRRLQPVNGTVPMEAARSTSRVLWSQGRPRSKGIFDFLEAPIAIRHVRFFGCGCATPRPRSWPAGRPGSGGSGAGRSAGWRRSQPPRAQRWRAAARARWPSRRHRCV